MSDSDRILAEGVPLTLASGDEVRVRFGMRALKTLEDTYGSIAGIQKALVALEQGDGLVIGTVVTLLCAGTGRGEDSLIDDLEPRHFPAYAAAIIAAVRQAFPENPPGEAAGEVVQIDSRGGSGTTSPQSDTPAATGTSG